MNPQIEGIINKLPKFLRQEFQNGHHQISFLDLQSRQGLTDYIDFIQLEDFHSPDPLPTSTDAQNIPSLLCFQDQCGRVGISFKVCIRLPYKSPSTHGNDHPLVFSYFQRYQNESQFNLCTNHLKSWGQNGTESVYAAIDIFLKEKGIPHSHLLCTEDQLPSTINMRGTGPKAEVFVTNILQNTDPILELC